MSAWIGAIILVSGFVALMARLGLVSKSRKVLETTRRSVAVIQSRVLDDEAKEAALQANAKSLLWLFVLLAGGGAAALFLPVAILWVADRLGWISLEAVFAVTVSPLFLAITTGLLVAGIVLRGRNKGAAGGYSGLDRCLHRVAFASYGPQAELADLETRVYSPRLGNVAVTRPVFVAGLPRAGTTLLLECLAGLPEFASHCYRDMPFVLLPLFWNRFAAAFQQSGGRRERAHGDGMLIDYDSPEALEEIVWHHFWKDHYRADRIGPWSGRDARSEFTAFFKDHMRKIVALRSPSSGEPARYISKNNLNIARPELLRRLFPDGTLIVPFRDPLCHAQSLREQHVNFCRIHREDAFARTYMRAIGHYDFGANLRPVDFGGWLDARQTKDSSSLTFWVEYWIAAYQYLLDRHEIVNVLDFDGLCRDAAGSLGHLARVLGSRDEEAIVATAAKVSAPRRREIDEGAVPASLLQKARDLHAGLKEAAFNVA